MIFFLKIIYFLLFVVLGIKKCATEWCPCQILVGGIFFKLISSIPLWRVIGVKRPLNAFFIQGKDMFVGLR